MIKLKPRLTMASAMVRSGTKLADIGTDHAYLPVALVLNSTVSHAIAADLRKGPLENARTAVIANNCGGMIELRLSDGLKLIQPDEADDIVIAGMGGILIAEILSAAPWVKDSSKKLILQPQSHDEDLRKYLFENGFVITEEKSCFEDGKSYICFSAEYTGKAEKHIPAEVMFGSFFKRTDEASKDYMNKKMKRIRTREQALSAHDPQSQEAELLKEIIKEVEQWQQ